MILLFILKNKYKAETNFQYTLRKYNKMPELGLKHYPDGILVKDFKCASTVADVAKKAREEILDPSISALIVPNIAGFSSIEHSTPYSDVNKGNEILGLCIINGDNTILATKDYRNLSHSKMLPKDVPHDAFMAENFGLCFGIMTTFLQNFSPGIMAIIFGNYFQLEPHIDQGLKVPDHKKNDVIPLLPGGTVVSITGRGHSTVIIEKQEQTFIKQNKEWTLRQEINLSSICSTKLWMPPAESLVIFKTVDWPENHFPQLHSSPLLCEHDNTNRAIAAAKTYSHNGTLDLSIPEPKD